MKVMALCWVNGREFIKRLCRGVIECGKPERRSTTLVLVALEFCYHPYVSRAKKIYSKKKCIENKAAWQEPSPLARQAADQENLQGWS